MKTIEEKTKLFAKLNDNELRHYLSENQEIVNDLLTNIRLMRNEVIKRRKSKNVSLSKVNN